MATIYIIKNTINNKCYVGQCTCSVQSRFTSHLCDPNRTIPLHADMDLYGADKFYFEVLDTCADDIRLDLETYYIDKFNTLMPNGYNVYRHSSDGFSNKNNSEQTKSNLSITSKRWWNTVDAESLQSRNRKISEQLKGRKFSEEHRRKISEHAKLRTGEKNPFYGKHHTDEYKKMMSEKYKGKNAYWYGKHASEETRKKQSEMRKGHFVSDETKKKMSEHFKGKVPFQMVQVNYKKVQQFTLDGQFIKEFESIKQAEQETNTCHGKISLVCLGKRKSAGGYLWKYKEVA